MKIFGIRLYLILQCLASFFLSSKLLHFTSHDHNLVAVVHGSAVALIVPFVVGIFLFGATFFPIKKQPDGRLTYDPNLWAWKLVKKLDTGYNHGPLHWCSINWKLNIMIGTVAGFITMMTITIASGPHHPMDWYGLGHVLSIALPLMAVIVGLPALIVSKLYKRCDSNNQGYALVNAGVVAYIGCLFAGVFYYGTHSWTATFVRLGRLGIALIVAIAGAALLSGAFILMIKLGKKVFTETAFGHWSRNLCPTFYAAPTTQR